MRAFIIVLFLTISSFASEERVAIKAQILEKIFTNICIDQTVVLWSDDEELLLELQKSSLLFIAQNPQAATMIIVKDIQSIKNNEGCREKPVFVLNYELLKEVPESFGALFWKKGRPNIVIIKPRAKLQNIKVSKELDAYKEERVW